MTTNREETMLKLLAIQPETKPQLIVETGWGVQETEAVLDRLMQAGRVTYRNGGYGAHGDRRYYPTGRAA